MKYILPKHTYYLDAISYFFMLAQIVILLLYWKGLDERVPIHFNLLGSPDGYGSKYVLWILPIVSILLFAGLKSFRFIKFNRYLAKFDKQLSMNLYKLYCSWTSLVSALTLFFFFILLYASIQIQPLEKIPSYIIIVYFGGLILSVIVYGIIESSCKKKYINSKQKRVARWTCYSLFRFIMDRKQVGYLLTVLPRQLLHRNHMYLIIIQEVWKSAF